MTTVADSEAQFREQAATHENREEWFAEADEQAAAARGLKPNVTQCIGFSVPLVFSQSGSPDTPYVADLYEHISFLGDLNWQISSLPDGAKVRLRSTGDFAQNRIMSAMRISRPFRSGRRSHKALGLFYDWPSTRPFSRYMFKNVQGSSYVPSHPLNRHDTRMVGVRERKGVTSHGKGEGVHSSDPRQAWRPG